MALTLPTHFAKRHVAKAWTYSSHAIASYCILASFVALVGLQASQPGLTLWPALVALLAMFVNLLVLQRWQTPLSTIAYLLVGGACLFLYSITVTFEVSVAAHTDAFLVSLPKLALVFVGAGSGVLTTIAWSAAGLVIAESAVAIATLNNGGQLSFDVASVGAFGSICALILLVSLSRSRSAIAQPSFARAARDEHLSALRYRIEVKAAAIMHDTVLNHLATIASARPGVIAPELRRQINRDLEVLMGEEWLIESRATEVSGSGEWRGSPLFEVIEEAEALGLTVAVTGDVSAVARLGATHAQALALAAKQCLVNIMNHAGVAEAEVVIQGSESEVTVMVIDAGVGFSASETASDRLGLRQSVYNRIEAVDGSVRVWSSPGRGTSVILSVPARVDAASRTRSGS